MLQKKQSVLLPACVSGEVHRVGRQLTRVCFVGVLLQTFLALGELEMVLVDDGVEGKVATADHLAGVAMAEDVLRHVHFYVVGHSTAVTRSIVLAHSER